MKFRGIGEVKAITITAAMELGRRRQLSNIKDRPQIQSSKDAFQLLAPLLQDLGHEEFLDINCSIVPTESSPKNESAWEE